MLSVSSNRVTISRQYQTTHLQARDFLDLEAIVSHEEEEEEEEEEILSKSHEMVHSVIRI